LLTLLQFDTADGQQPRHFALREIVHRLVRGDAVFVEAARFLARVEHAHAMPRERERMRARQTRRPGADHGDFTARLARAMKQRRGARRFARHLEVGGMALQRADLNRFAILMISYARAFAEDFSRAHARAHAAQRIGAQNIARGALEIAVADLADKAGNVDAGGAGRDAGRVVTVVTAVGGDDGRVGGKRRGDIGELAA
jgi:hypothetical protein